MFHIFAAYQFAPLILKMLNNFKVQSLYLNYLLGNSLKLYQIHHHTSFKYLDIRNKHQSKVSKKPKIPNHMKHLVLQYWHLLELIHHLSIITRQMSHYKGIFSSRNTRLLCYTNLFQKLTSHRRHYAKHRKQEINVSLRKIRYTSFH